MDFLHSRLHLNSGETVEVTLDKQANVKLMDDQNFRSYKRGERHGFYGGLAVRSPLRVRAPRAGTWHLVIDLGGYSGRVKASVRTLH